MKKPKKAPDQHITLLISGIPENFGTPKGLRPATLGDLYIHQLNVEFASPAVRKYAAAIGCDSAFLYRGRPLDEVHAVMEQVVAQAWESQDEKMRLSRIRVEVKAARALTSGAPKALSDAVGAILDLAIRESRRKP